MPPNASETEIKCVIVGDGAVGEFRSHHFHQPFHRKGNLNLIFTSIDRYDQTCMVCFVTVRISSSQVKVYVDGKFPEAYVPTVFENTYLKKECQGKKVDLALWVRI